MAGNSRIEDLYYRFINGFVADLKSDEFYDYFVNMVKGGTNNMTLNEKYVERNIDIRWVEAIEDTIIPLDNIIRTPNRFIKNIEEVVNIEMARNISTESVRHLATHTNYIAQVKGDEVIPSRILNVIKEESFETYENRFIFTLLFKLEYFLDKRMQVLMTNNKVADKYEMKFAGNCTAGHDEIEYDFSMNYVTPHVELTSEELQVGADITKLTSMQRIERLRKILYSFKASPLIKSLEHCAMVRPPLTMTNVLAKNPNFRKCVDLWRFIDRYEDVGFNVNVVDRLSTPSEQYVNDMFSLLTMQYVVMKKNTRHTDELGDYSERKKESELNVVKKSIEEIIGTYDLDINEIRRIFTDQLEKKKKKVKAEFAKINDIIKRAIANDKEYLAEFNEARKLRESKASMRLKAEKAAQKQEELAKLDEKNKEHADSPFGQQVVQETQQVEQRVEQVEQKVEEQQVEQVVEQQIEQQVEQVVEEQQVEPQVEQQQEQKEQIVEEPQVKQVEQVVEDKDFNQNHDDNDDHNDSDDGQLQTTDETTATTTQEEYDYKTPAKFEFIIPTEEQTPTSTQTQTIPDKQEESVKTRKTRYPKRWATFWFKGKDFKNEGEE